MKRLFQILGLSIVLNMSVQAVESPEYDVIVVGAGVSGLAATQYLESKGLKVVIVEARDRIGGRVYPMTLTSGSTVDLGGSWMHGLENNLVYQETKRLGLPSIPTDYEKRVEYDANGKFSLEKTHQEKVLFDDFLESLSQAQESVSQQSLGTFLQAYVQENGLSPEEVLLLNHVIFIAITSQDNTDPHDLSLYDLDIDTFGHENDAVLVSGYQAFLNTLKPQSQVLFNHPVSQIHTQEIPFVETHAGKMYAKAILCTAPLGVLKAGKIVFTPKLSDEKQSAIKRLGMGTLNKLVLEFDDVFWDDQMTLLEWVDEKGLWSVWYNAYPFTGKKILVGFNGGAQARQLESWSDDQTIASGMHVLQQMYGQNIPIPKASQVTRWTQDPWSLGSYSYPAVGSSVHDHDILAEPCGGKLFFAGEATEPVHYATVDGAYRSGIRAAKEIMDALKP